MSLKRKVARNRALARSMLAEPELEEEQLVIESDHPIPGTAAPQYRWLRKAFCQMKVGQSVVFCGHHGYIHWLAAMTGIKVRTRMTNGEKIPTRGRVLLRIWRVK